MSLTATNSALPATATAHVGATHKSGASNPSPSRSTAQPAKDAMSAMPSPLPSSTPPVAPAIEPPIEGTVSAAITSTAVPPSSNPVKPSVASGAAWAARAGKLAGQALPPVLGLGLLILLWQLVAQSGDGIPGPGPTWQAARELFADPFYRNGPNDQGIGWNILASLQRVALGFGLAALIGIPLGFAIGRFLFLNRMLTPVISLLRPVSPLAWLPIGLLVFKAADPAAIWTIFICSIWPMVINTATGVQRVPQDYMNVARVLDLSEWKIATRILLPAVLPYIVTGVRLAVGTAWLVIVAAEMLTGGVGIGFWIWDEWNNLNVANIIIAIFIIGTVGLVLETLLVRLASAVTYEDSKS